MSVIDYNIPSDTGGSWNGNAFAALFGGEYIFPDITKAQTGPGNIQEKP